MLTAVLNTDFQLPKQGTKKEKVLKPNFEKADFTAINAFFNDKDWEAMLNNKSVEDAWTICPKQSCK